MTLLEKVSDCLTHHGENYPFKSVLFGHDAIQCEIGINVSHWPALVTSQEHMKLKQRFGCTG
jgi:hypothetical protein